MINTIHIVTTKQKSNSLRFRFYSIHGIVQRSPNTIEGGIHPFGAVSGMIPRLLWFSEVFFITDQKLENLREIIFLTFRDISLRRAQSLMKMPNVFHFRLIFCLILDCQNGHTLYWFSYNHKSPINVIYRAILSKLDNIPFWF